MKKFEYATVFTDAKGFSGGIVEENMLLKTLNEYGADGWELVSSVSSNQAYGSTRYIISIFKRAINE